MCHWPLQIATNRKYSLLFSSPGSQGYTERAIPNFLDFVNNSYRHALQFIKLIKMCLVLFIQQADMPHSFEL